MSKAISVVCHQGFHCRCGHELLNGTICTCWCHHMPPSIPQCDDCWGLGETLDEIEQGVWIPCPVCNGTGKRWPRNTVKAVADA